MTQNPTSHLHLRLETVRKESSKRTSKTKLFTLPHSLLIFLMWTVLRAPSIFINHLKPVFLNLNNVNITEKNSVVNIFAFVSELFLNFNFILVA